MIYMFGHVSSAFLHPDLFYYSLHLIYLPTVYPPQSWYIVQEDRPPYESPGLLRFWIAPLGFCCCYTSTIFVVVVVVVVVVVIVVST